MLFLKKKKKKEILFILIPQSIIQKSTLWFLYQKLIFFLYDSRVFYCTYNCHLLFYNSKIFLLKMYDKKNNTNEKLQECYKQRKLKTISFFSIMKEKKILCCFAYDIYFLSRIHFGNTFIIYKVIILEKKYYR